MKPNELLDAGKLDAAVAELNEHVKKQPADNRLRTFLFETLCFTGDYDRAQRQLDVISHQSESAEIGVEVYREILRAEAARRHVFTDGQQPHFLLEPPPHVRLHLDALHLLRGGSFPQAKEHLDRSAAERPAVSGTIRGQRFSSFRDYDDLLGPVLEAISHDRYVWIPFSQIVRLSIPQPRFLRDLLWAPASIEMIDGSKGELFIPVLYVESFQDANDLVRLGRITEWIAWGGEIARGMGQRTFLIDQDERAVLELREVEFDQAPDAPSSS